LTAGGELELPFLSGTGSALRSKEEALAALDLEGRVEIDSAFRDLVPRVRIKSSHNETKR
jgi:hypothetical protein